MTEETDKTLGELIQEALRELGWSNAELARRTDFSPTYIGNLIRDYSPGTKSGKPTRLPAETVDRIADALKKSRSVFRRAAGLLPEDQRSSRSQVTDDLKLRALYLSRIVQTAATFPTGRLAQIDKIVEALKTEHPEGFAIAGDTVIPTSDIDFKGMPKELEEEEEEEEKAKAKRNS